MSSISAAELIRRGAAALEAAGIPDAAYDAKYLFDHSALSMSVGRDEGRTFNAETSAAYDQLIARRAQREPLQHITGSVGFLELDLKSDKRALIPRMDSETVAILALEMLGCRPFADPKSQVQVQLADLGTGSGVLLAALLHDLPLSRGVAVEASADALSLAAENFAKVGIADRAQLFFGSWMDWTGWEVCDLIISNPPYIRTDVVPTLASEVREFDPVEALDGGTDGLDAYREIISLGGTRMNAGASLVLEIGFDQKEAVTELLLQSGFYDLQHRQDLGGNDRAIAAIKS